MKYKVLMKGTINECYIIEEKNNILIMTREEFLKRKLREEQKDFLIFAAGLFITSFSLGVLFYHLILNT